MTTIVLVGLMGAGKSTVGRLIADRLGRSLIDSDRTIEERTGSTVRQLWEEGGEAAYRRLESAVVLDAIADSPPVVVAAPGGVVLDTEVRDALASAFVVWLRSDPATLAERVRTGDHRPLLGSDPASVLARMATDRAALYAEISDAVVDVDGVDANRAAEQVLDLYVRAAPAAADLD